LLLDRSLLVDDALAYLDKTEIHADFYENDSSGKTVKLPLLGNIGDTSHMDDDANSAGARADAEVKTILSDEGKFNQYLAYVRGSYIRHRTDTFKYSINQKMKAIKVPLLEQDQADHLFNELSIANPKNYGRYNVITSEVLAQASTYFSADQMDALRAVQSRDLAMDAAVAEAIRTNRYTRKI
jgi:hypothetical protein